MATSPIQPFVEWASAVLHAVESGGEYVPPKQTLQRFNTVVQPVGAPSKEMDAIFQPAAIEISDKGLSTMIRNIVQAELDASEMEADLFSQSSLKVIRELETYENWVKEPLTAQELQDLHAVLHVVLHQLASQNNEGFDVSRWPSENDILAADKLFLAVAYVLAWQPYGAAMQFVWSLAKPWYSHLSEVVSEYLERDELFLLHSSLNCLRDRVYHFDNLMYGFMEGGGSMEVHEDISVDDHGDVDAIAMYNHTRAVHTSDRSVRLVDRRERDQDLDEVEDAETSE